jgi:hypothetical protein
MVRLEGLGKLKRISDFKGTRTPDIPASSTVPEPSSHPVPGECKYGDLALEIVGVSIERENMVVGSARLRPESDCIANYRLVLSSERAPHIKNEAIVQQTGNWNLIMGAIGVLDIKTDLTTNRRS